MLPNKKVIIEFIKEQLSIIKEEFDILKEEENYRRSEKRGPGNIEKL